MQLHPPEALPDSKSLELPMIPNTGLHVRLLSTTSCFFSRRWKQDVLMTKQDDHVTVTRIYIAPAPLPFRPRPGRESRTATPAQEEASPSTAAAVAVASR